MPERRPNGDPRLSVREAASALGLTPQGVRNAAKAGRLAAAVRPMPNGRNDFDIRASAVEAFKRDRITTPDDRLENLQLHLDLAIADSHQKDLQVLELGKDLAAARAEIQGLKTELRALYTARLAALGPEDEDT